MKRTLKENKNDLYNATSELHRASSVRIIFVLLAPILLLHHCDVLITLFFPFQFTNIFSEEKKEGRGKEYTNPFLYKLRTSGREGTF